MRLTAALGAWLTVMLPVSGAAVAGDAEILAGCPLAGDARDAKTRAVNTLKRRTAAPTPADVDAGATLKALTAPGDDTGRFDDMRAATIEGYVAGVKVGGIESANCHTHAAAFRDTHIELTLDPLAGDASTYVIAEVTPQVRQEMAAQGVDWSTSALRARLLGRWVRVSGWLLFDLEHRQNARNTAPGGARIWRATAWEVHPIASLEVLPGKPQ